MPSNQKFVKALSFCYLMIYNLRVRASEEARDPVIRKAASLRKDGQIVLHGNP
jgi:hypothetical protein